MKNLPNEATEAMGDRTDGLGMTRRGTSRRDTIARMERFAFTAALAAWFRTRRL
jgi:hypothetical protein